MLTCISMRFEHQNMGKQRVPLQIMVFIRYQIQNKQTDVFLVVELFIRE